MFGSAFVFTHPQPGMADRPSGRDVTIPAAEVMAGEPVAQHGHERRSMPSQQPHIPAPVRLNGLNTSTPVSGFWAGFTIAPEQWVGPRFTLPEQTRITEIGGFVFGRLPFVVSILPQINGLPDISTTLATLTLSNNLTQQN